MKKSMEFKLKSNGNELEELEQKTSNFLKYHGYPDSTIHAQLMILRELITSGKKIDDLRLSEFEMSVDLQIENDSITVEVKKSVCESAYGKLEELDKEIQWIRGYQDPFEPYSIKLAEASSTSHSAETVGFGLAKIAYEADAIIDFYVSEDNILNLSAVCNLNA